MKTLTIMSQVGVLKIQKIIILIDLQMNWNIGKIWKKWILMLRKGNIEEIFILKIRVCKMIILSRL